MYFNKALVGRNLSHNNLTDMMKSDSQMLLFLRHLGCNLGKKLLSDISKTEKEHGVKFPIIFVSQGSRNYNEHFWAKQYPEYSVIYDTDLSIAKSYGVREGTLTEALNPGALYCALKAVGSGFIPSTPQPGGNIYMMPAVFVYVNGSMVFSHIAQTASDLPDFEELVKTYLSEAVSA